MQLLTVNGELVMSLYFRLLWIWIRASRKPAIRMGDRIEISMRVLPHDLDINGHMNNGRYLTITDLALVEYLTRAGFLKLALRKGWRPMLGGSIISYRRALKPFASYSLHFTMACWDERWTYMTFEFRQGDRTMAHGHSKGAIVGSTGIVSSSDARGVMGLDATSPHFPASIRTWIEAERLLSA
jgi:acyl-CoA thioesterase FadM